MIGLGIGVNLGEITPLEDRWFLNSDPESVPGVAYKVLVAEGNIIDVATGVVKI